MARVSASFRLVRLRASLIQNVLFQMEGTRKLSLIANDIDALCFKTLILLYSEIFEVAVGVLSARYAQQGDAIIRLDRFNEGGSDVYDIYSITGK